MERFTDDSSAALGLDHSPVGEPIDARGRKIVALPPPAGGYRPDLVDLGPAEMAALIAAEEAERADRQDDDLARIMREAPGGRTPGHGSHGGRRRAPAPSAYDRTEQPIGANVAIEVSELRPNVVSGRVSMYAYRGIYGAGNPSFGEMAEVLGLAIAATDWQTVAVALRSCAGT